MKKIFLSFATLLALVTVSNAQNTSPYWSLVGNSNATSSSKLGTTNAVLLRFFTKNLERMRIDTLGHVGIGTTNPTDKLHINSASGANALRAQVNGLTKLLVHSGGGVSIGSSSAPPSNGLFVSGNTGIGISSPKGKLHVKGNANASQLIIDANATQSNTQPLIRLRNSAGTDLLHIHSDDPSNIFIGLNSGKVNTLNQSQGIANTFIGYSSGTSNTTGSYNTATGYDALYSNSGGNSNTANGRFALYNNSAGNFNTAIGQEALYTSTVSYNTGVGYRALYLNNSGVNNTACGLQALYTNSSGNSSTAFGINALYSSTGNYNTAVGDYALFNTTSAWGNTAVGDIAGASYHNGYYNTFIGAETDATAADIYNSTALGRSTQVTAASQVRIGNSFVTSIGGYADWTKISDGRVKKNIKQNVPGLVFINKLQPVTYNLDLDAADKITQPPVRKDKEARPDDPIGQGRIMAPSQLDITARQAKEQIVYTGFVAQDVEKAAKDLNYNFSGVDAAKNDKDLYGLRYAEFVVPLVKAVQELSKMNDEKDKKIQELEIKNQDMDERLKRLESLINNQGITAIHVNGYLKQNAPNPFNANTVISYYIPDNTGGAQIKIIDSKGSLLKTFNAVKGEGQINIRSGELPAGTYNYTLYISDKKIDTKQMVITK